MEDSAKNQSEWLVIHHKTQAPKEIPMPEQEDSPFIQFGTDLRRGHTLVKLWKKRYALNTEYGGVFHLERYMDAVYDRYRKCCRLTGELAKKKSEWLLEGVIAEPQELNTGDSNE